MGIVLPDSILGSPGLGYIREWMIRNHRIIASIDLNVDTVSPPAIGRRRLTRSRALGSTSGLKSNAGARPLSTVSLAL